MANSPRSRRYYSLFVVFSAFARSLSPHLARSLSRLSLFPFFPSHARFFFLSSSFPPSRPPSSFFHQNLGIFLHGFRIQFKTFLIIIYYIRSHSFLFFFSYFNSSFLFLIPPLLLISSFFFSSSLYSTPTLFFASLQPFSSFFLRISLYLPHHQILRPFMRYRDIRL